MTEYINHPLIRPNTVEQRLYQLNLASSALKKSSLIVLPTGLGKTVIALLCLVEKLKDGKCIILSPTKPLVEQHANFLKSVLEIPEKEILVFTGAIQPSKRIELWKRGRVIVATPQVIENDLLGKRISLNEVAFMTFDEAHRAVGNYSYVYIAEKYKQQNPSGLILGITASPGSDEDHINEVCKNLYIYSIEVRTEVDRDVKDYVHSKEIEWIYIKLPEEIIEIKSLMEKVLKDRLSKLSELGFIRQNRKEITKSELLELQQRLQTLLQQYPIPSNDYARKIYKGISLQAEIFKVNHAIELIETQGLDALKKYFERLSRDKSLATKRLIAELNIKKAIHLALQCNSEHPKLNKVKEIVSEQLKNHPDSRVIVFTNYRDTAELVANSLVRSQVSDHLTPKIKPIKFIGQSSKYKDKGMTQKKQVEIIDKFKSGEYNVLCATAIAEEGLDIPSTDLVLFYEPVPSEIRSIQRSGRTGRFRSGRIVVLIAKGTKDEVYYWSSRSKEKKMQKKIKDLSDIGEKNGLMPDKTEQKPLLDFDGESVKIYVDNREKPEVAKTLEKFGVEIILKNLEVADYILSERVGVQRKITLDLLNGLINKKMDLFRQLKDLSRNYIRPILIIEGEDLYTARQVHPNAIRGLLASISIDFGIPIIFSKNSEETAIYLYLIAKREQIDLNKDLISHGKRSALMLNEQQEYVVSSIADIGPVVARNLLRHFGSVEKVMTASKEELRQVELVGEKTADKIRDVVGSEYKG
ncbi:MAG TPA: DEAD/DEAH box helicase [Methanosarcinales archaeon]|nr:DEAD/DEAH box helicase [Methanosarcinales archaeon]